jgi:uncharacterized Zn finger protein
MAKIIKEYCNDCRKETIHEYQNHNKWQLLTKCNSCGANFDLIPDGRVFEVKGTGKKFKL